MKHPLAKIRENQAAFLKNIPADERPTHEQLFRIGNATYCYHQSATTLEPSEVDFAEWLEGLPEPMKSDMKNKGFDACKGILSFTRYVNEKNDMGMDAWMKNKLSPEDYTAYKNP